MSQLDRVSDSNRGNLTLFESPLIVGGHKVNSNTLMLVPLLLTLMTHVMSWLLFSFCCWPNVWLLCTSLLCG